LAVRAAERQVDRAEDLLVEQRAASWPGDVRVGADADLPEAPCAGVDGQLRVEDLLPERGRGLDDLAALEAQPDVLDPRAAHVAGSPERDGALGALPQRPGEHLARRRVALAVGVEPGAAGGGEAQIGAGTSRVELARLRGPLHQPLLPRAERAPARR